jgi:hypothetical protein
MMPFTTKQGAEAVCTLSKFMTCLGAVLFVPMALLSLPGFALIVIGMSAKSHGDNLYNSSERSLLRARQD